MEPQAFQNNDFDKKMIQYRKLPNRDKRETSTACSATEQKSPGLFSAELGNGKIEFTNKVTIEIIASEQDDNSGLQLSDFAPDE